MKHKTFLTALAAVTVMTGCLKVEKKSAVAARQAQTKAQQPEPPPQPKPKQALTRPLRLDEVFIEFEAEPQPNVYNMILSWPETSDRVRISVNGQVMFAVNTAERTKEAVGQLQGGRKVAVFIEILDAQFHVITSETRDLDVPKDYVFPHEYKLAGDVKIHDFERVFLNNSVITTENFKLDIRTKKLIVLDKSVTLDKSRFQNFIPGTKAKHGHNGRNGGLVAVKADAAEGDITFLMNSEAGGDALKGFMHRSSIGGGLITEHAICVFGTNGFAAGKNGDLNLQIKNISDFRPYVQETLSEGGSLAPVLNNPDTSPGYPSLSMDMMRGDTCPKRPSPGAAAQPGKICQTFSGQVPSPQCE